MSAELSQIASAATMLKIAKRQYGMATLGGCRYATASVGNIVIKTSAGSSSSIVAAPTASTTSGSNMRRCGPHQASAMYRAPRTRNGTNASVPIPSSSTVSLIVSGALKWSTSRTVSEANQYSAADTYHPAVSGRPMLPKWPSSPSRNSAVRASLPASPRCGTVSFPTLMFFPSCSVNCPSVESCRAYRQCVTARAVVPYELVRTSRNRRLWETALRWTGCVSGGAMASPSALRRLARLVVSGRCGRAGGRTTISPLKPL